MEKELIVENQPPVLMMYEQIGFQKLFNAMFLYRQRAVVP